jgi:hypothetical protein
VQWQAREQLKAATPADAGPPERNARECMPSALFELEAQRERMRASGGRTIPPPSPRVGMKRHLPRRIAAAAKRLTDLGPSAQNGLPAAHRIDP